ncbi:MAG: YdcF family protein [Clostridia bacterium]|nr:YdcF family protein [Clostridia bacterium]
MKRLFRIVLSLIIIVAICILAINIYVKSSVKNQINANGTDGADCILVLGAGVINGVPTNMLEDRILEAVKLYNQGASSKIIMSGDHGRKDYDEVNVMKSFAIERGIPDEDIFMDHAGFSTYESLYRAKEIFGVRKVIIVTQEYHLYRALYIANCLGLEAVGTPSDPRAYYGQEFREVREILARNKDFLYCIFKPKPTFLGEAIPVSGNGNVTND